MDAQPQSVDSLSVGSNFLGVLASLFPTFYASLSVADLDLIATGGNGVNPFQSGGISLSALTRGGHIASNIAISVDPDT